MSAPPKLFETEKILAAYREEQKLREAGAPASPRARLAEALALLAAGEGAAVESRELFRSSHLKPALTRTQEEKLLKPRILLIVEIAALAGRNQALLAELIAMERDSRAEEGCLEYTMLRSLSEPLRFVVYEIWQSAEHLDRHRQTPHYLAFGPAVGPLIVAPPKLMEVPLADVAREPKGLAAQLAQGAVKRPEGPGNLERRAGWFKSRAGGSDEG